MKVRRTKAELQEMYEEQLQLLTEANNSYDKGFRGAAKWIAVSLRVLLHDTARSHSLIELVGRGNTEFYDTTFPDRPWNRQAYTGLISIKVEPQGNAYFPHLDLAPRLNKVGFDVYWNATVLRDMKGNEFSRKDLVSLVANKEGGAHVDPKLEERYHDLLKKHSMGWSEVGGSGEVTPIADIEQASIRQIAHEVLKSLVKGYEKKPENPGRMIGGASSSQPDSSVLGVHGPGMVSSIPLEAMDPDGPCPCGSGKKFKECHGR